MHNLHFGATDIDFLGPTRRCQTPKRTNHYLFGENKVSKVQEGLAVISWFPQLLQDLYTIRNISNILPTP